MDNCCNTKIQHLLGVLENGGSTEGVSGSGNTKTQDYIMTLIGSVDEAKAAVVAKGGTVGDTGLNGLASEIDSIPSGGGSTSWGTVTYNDGGVQKTAEIQGADDFMTLCGGSAVNAVINGITIGKSSIWYVDLPNFIIYLPDTFLQNATNLRGLTGVKNVRKVGTSVLGSSGVREPLEFDTLEEIGDYFLEYCSTFNSTLSIPKAKKIGTYFMRQCTGFQQSLTIPNTITDSSAIGSGFMNRCNAFTGPLVCEGPSGASSLPSDNNTLATNSASAVMYTTGITLTGTYASVWKNRFADRTSSPYRKLILGA